MNNFEKVAASPEMLGAFLASLHVATGPWDESFHRTFCDSCEREDCDMEHCPNQDKRNNPTWWLKLGDKEINIAMDGKCVDFNVYIGKKELGGLLLEGIEEVLMPAIVTYEKEPLQPGMTMELAFRSMVYAGPVIGKMRIPCTIEIRVAVSHWAKAGTWEIEGQSYILEATPTEIVHEPLTRGGRTGVVAWFKVDKLTANDEAGNPLWSFGKDEAGE